MDIMVDNTSKKKKLQAVAVIMSVAVFMFSILSVTFIAHEADHDCCHDHCPICELIVVCGQAFHSFGDSAAPLIAAFAMILFLIASTPAHSRNNSSFTLVNLKIQLNN